MNDRPDGSEPGEPSRYEDWASVVEPSADRPAAPRRRTPTLTMATVILALSGTLPLLSIVLFSPDRTTKVLLGLLGVAELTGAVLVGTLRPIGRPVGIVLGAIGVVLGIATAGSSVANGIVTIALNGFVIYAVASSGPAFRRG